MRSDWMPRQRPSEFDPPFRSVPAGNGLYLHFPFCRKRCSYCGFVCHAGLDFFIEPYLEALEREIAFYPAWEIATLYLGGGTPSLLASSSLVNLLDRITKHFCLASTAEVTLEVNPGTGSPALWEAARLAGVNRISLGIQALDITTLQLLGRDHTMADIERTVSELRSSGFTDLSFDLLYGLPGQTLKQWDQTLAAAIALTPEHLSLYSLQVEENTLFSAWQRQGLLVLPGEDDERAMLDLLAERLVTADFRRYEISSWSKPGHESAHNRIYWYNRPYIGLGAGAHSYHDGRRYAHGRSVRSYLQDPVPKLSSGRQTRQETMAETLFLGLRLTLEGIWRADFAARFGKDPYEEYGPAIDRLVRLGLLEITPERLRLSPAGIPLANEVFVAFL
ncbi:MAG: radical SAM family heme chaperone HemW [Cyanobacteria bacterium NC_groundwater_1444_Ag_S-0.65um_54_12]|nr:radical SAM family heme chaperone HemW [Cyanobacteria bacterium NC_groundwater_1444_Ag_S-0.65um_54_12]